MSNHSTEQSIPQAAPEMAPATDQGNADQSRKAIQHPGEPSDRSDLGQAVDPANPSQTNSATPDRPDPIDVRDLVYSGGYSRDPQEILSNPAVAPPMLNDGRDLRGDLYAESEATLADPTDSDD